MEGVPVLYLKSVAKKKYDPRGSPFPAVFCFVLLRSTIRNATRKCLTGHCRDCVPAKPFVAFFFVYARLLFVFHFFYGYDAMLNAAADLWVPRWSCSITCLWGNYFSGGIQIAGRNYDSDDDGL